VDGVSFAVDEGRSMPLYAAFAGVLAVLLFRWE
jgi:hypothetical protein